MKRYFWEYNEAGRISTGTFRLLIVYCLLATNGGFTSCTHQSQQKQHLKDVNAAIREEVEKYTYPLPSVFEASEMLTKIEAEYMPGITNPAEKAESYFTEKTRALILGIYTADLAYATTYNQRVETQDYLKACETLVRELDFAAAFDPNLVTRMEEALDKKNELVDLITEMFQNAYAYLKQQGRDELSYLVLSGTIVEALYLTMHISESTFQNPRIVEAILFQKEPLLELQNMMEDQKNSVTLSETYQDILQMNRIYAEEPGNTSLSEKQMRELMNLVNSVRNRYISKQ